MTFKNIKEEKPQLHKQTRTRRNNREVEIMKKQPIQEKIELEAQINYVKLNIIAQKMGVSVDDYLLFKEKITRFNSYRLMFIIYMIAFVILGILSLLTFSYSIPSHCTENIIYLTNASKEVAKQACDLLLRPS